MKAVHYAGIPCGSVEPEITYSHENRLITCQKCLDILSGKVVEDNEEKAEVKADDKRRTKKGKRG